MLKRRDIRKKEKEDELVDIKNIIIRKCRHSLIRGHIVLSKILLITKLHLETRRTQIEEKFRRKLAISVIQKSVRKWLRKKCMLMENKVRHSLLFPTTMKHMTEYQNRQARNTLKMFLV